MAVTFMPIRRFPEPWTLEDHNEACFIVKDANGLAVAYVYYEEETKGEASIKEGCFRQS
jgi:hypothetical protein